MTHFINNSEFEIIEQNCKNNWVVRNVDTSIISDISDYYFRNIHQDDHVKKGQEMAGWIASGFKA